jgi:hypothetical protein
MLQTLIFDVTIDVAFDVLDVAHVRTPTIRTKRSVVRMFFHTTRLNNRKP